MESTQTQFLTIYDDSLVYHRWNNSYIGKAVTFNGERWAYHPFNADGITSGDAASEGSLVVDVPCTAIANDALRIALRNSHLIQIAQYEFVYEPGQPDVPADQRLVAFYIGEVTSVKGTFTSLSVELGSTLSPVGVQVPPRTYSTFLVGVPCQL